MCSDQNNADWPAVSLANTQSDGAGGRMKKSTGMERLIKTLQDQIDDWKEKCLSLEAR